MQLEHIYEKGSRIVIGVSGGADSVCLMHKLVEEMSAWQLTLYVLHVHHGIRGSEADRDCRFVEKMAGSLGLPFESVWVDVPGEVERTGESEEEAARRLRYQALFAHCQKVSADYIALAHHKEDQAETVLFQMFRGSSPRGLAGIPKKRGRIIRPLLGASRQQIEQYLRQHGISWCQDSTNAELQYSRNCIREEIVPLIEQKINDKASDHIADLAMQMREWREYVEAQGECAAGRWIRQKESGWEIPVEAFQKEHPVIQGELLRRVFEHFIPAAKDLSKVHYEQVLALKDKQVGKEVFLPQNVRVRRGYQSLVFCCGRSGEETPADDIFIECHIPGQHKVLWEGEEFILEFQVIRRTELPEEIPQKDYTKWFDYDMIKHGLVLRNPRKEDFFAITSDGKKKMLGRYFIDRKIPREQRAHQLLLADGAHAVWIFPDRISERYKITGKTEHVLVVRKRGREHERRN